MSNNKMFVPGAALDGLRLALEAENKKLRAEIENAHDRLYLASIKVADALAEASKLRARVKVLEQVRAAAQALAGYRFGWLGWEEKVEALRVALKEAKP